MKRKISLLTAVFMVMYSLCAFGAAFSDMPDAESEYYQAFQYAVDKNIINGDGDKIMPSSPVTRAQAAVMLSRALNLTDKADLFSVSDVSEGDWYYDAFACTVKSGIFTVSDGKLFPDSVLDRRSAALLVYDSFSNSSSDYKALLSLSNPTAAATRADFILWIYNYTNPMPAPSEALPPEAAPTEASTAEAATEAVTEAVTEPSSAPTEAASEAATEALTEAAVTSDYQKKAEEARQLAFGILSDGTSYIPTLPIYHDGGSSPGGSGDGTSSSGGSSSGGQKPTSPTEAPTEPPTQTPTEAPTEPPTQAPTEPPTYDGPISNDNDNVIEDPFDDGWNSDGDSEDDGDDIIGNPDADTPTNSEEEPSENSGEPEGESSSSDEGESEPLLAAVLTKERWLI